jgi:hypothetical protein
MKLSNRISLENYIKRNFWDGRFHEGEKKIRNAKDLIINELERYLSVEKLYNLVN